MILYERISKPPPAVATAYVGRVFLDPPEPRPKGPGLRPGFRVRRLTEDSMSKKVSRRQFARTSVAASAAAVTLPGGLLTNGRGKSATLRSDVARQAAQNAAGQASGWREGHTVPA